MSTRAGTSLAAAALALALAGLLLVQLVLRARDAGAELALLDAPGRPPLIGASAAQRLEFALGPQAALHAALVRAATPGAQVFYRELDPQQAMLFFQLRALLFPLRLHALRDLPADWMPAPGALDDSDLLVDHSPEQPFAARALFTPIERGAGWELLRFAGAPR